MRLNLGSGGDYIEGYINVDLYAEKADERFDIANLPYSDNTVDEIRAYHVIEHFDYIQAHDVLKEWNRVLKPSAKIRIETPDLLESCKEFVKADIDGQWDLYGHFFSTPWVNPGLVHKFLYTEYQLRKLMDYAGFKNCQRLEPNSGYVNAENKHIFLNIEAIK